MKVTAAPSPTSRQKQARTRIDANRTNGTNSTNNTVITIDVESTKKIILYVQSKFYEYKRTVLLYSKFIQEFIDYLYETKDKDAKILMYYIMDLVELDKDFFISGNISNSLKDNINKDIHLINPALKRFGLIPITDSMLLDDLIQLITDKKVTYKVNDKVNDRVNGKTINLEKLAKEKNIGFILMRHVVYTPVEYNLKPLILPDVAKCLIQPQEFGITEKTIERFQTIKTLKDIDKINTNAYEHF